MHYNYHTHTYRCRHASGTEREYIEAVIGAGITKLGFSDHVPFIFPDGFESDYRVEVSAVADYMDTINRLREEYKGKIEIYAGFEMEYYRPYFKEMLENVRRWGAQYLILGQHYIRNEHPDGTSCTTPCDSEEDFAEHIRDVTEAINSGVFTYVAHPDIFNFTGPEEVYIREMRKICIAAKEKNVPLEINFLGIRDRRHYPNELFWKIAGEVGNSVVYGMDAHTAEGARDLASKVYADELVRKNSLKFLSEPKLIRIDR